MINVVVFVKVFNEFISSFSFFLVIELVKMVESLFILFLNWFNDKFIGIVVNSYLLISWISVGNWYEVIEFY